MPPTHFDRYATITIQGGGVYGLNLLGQLAGVVVDREIIPIALAGNSAGAIIATLYWAGLTPLEIRDKFKDACIVGPGANRSQLMDMLGPFEAHPGGAFDLGKFHALKQRFDGYLATLDSQLMVEDGPDRAGRPGQVRSLPSYIEGFCRAVMALLQLRKASRDVSPHVRNNGVFRGSNFEATIDRWIRDSPAIRRFDREPGRSGLIPPPVGREGGRLLTFGDIAVLQDREAVLFPPLFLTTTNLTLRRLEVISSFDPAYGHWPIARAVRASAGFPVFFRPVAVEGWPVGCWYVDGGIISNFPSWVFGPKFRSSLSGPGSEYGYWSSYPWLNVGLRVVDDPGPGSPAAGPGDPKPIPMPPHPLKPKEFLDSLIGLATGRARNEIEGILSTFVSRSRTVLQPVSDTAGPENLMAFHQVDADRVDAMFESGRIAACREFADVDYRLPGPIATRRVVGLLGTLAERAWAILRPAGSTSSAREFFRANVYLPQGDKLRPWCSWNMDGAVDATLEFELGCGLTGFCHARRRPLLGNLETIDDEYRRGGSGPTHFFGMHDTQQERVAPGRTWLASFPIFDPGDVGLHQGPVDPEPAEWPYYCEVASPVEAGGVFGVLNLDGAFDHGRVGLHPEPARNLTDHRIAAIIALMQAAAFEVGQVLSQGYPASSKVRGD